jgi:hypothetical protein
MNKKDVLSLVPSFVFAAPLFFLLLSQSVPPLVGWVCPCGFLLPWGFFWGLLPRQWQCCSLSFCSELFMKLIECSVEGLTAYLKTLAADDPKVQMVKLLLEELKAK